jgi:osmotically-inducible protein OsmY
MNKTDKELQHAVEQELLWEPSVHAEHIGVSVNNGIVQLDGHVNGYAEKWGAERAAMRVASVKGVASELKVKLPSSDTRTDADIARAALNVLDWNLMVPDTVKVQVTDGCLTVEGAVEWQYQKEEAERAVRSLMGVKSVVNEITVKPRVSAVQVKSKIEDAFKRSAEIDAGHVKVEATGGTVTLRGNVSSWAERGEAERVAWAAPGVTNVKDLITIS